jgi:hypothetical protein
MSNIENEAAEWVVSFWKNAEVSASEIAKGGEGSGEHVGHPFRGNRYTGGVQSASHHETRPGTENFGHAQHLTAASSHIAAGRVAMAHGQFGIARGHFNEAAYHAAKASSIIQHGGGTHHGGANREMGHHAEMLYHAAHHAGDAAERANYLTNAHQDAVASGRGSTVVTREQLLNTAAGRAASSTNNADRAGTYGPADNRLVPEGRASDRILSTDELGSAAAGARENAMRQADLAGAADAATNAARDLYAPAQIGYRGTSRGSGQIASGQ